MAGELQPLSQNFKIVDENGFPSLYFIKWAQQRQIDIGSAITLQNLLDYLTAHQLIAGTGIQLTPDGNISDTPTIHADVQAILDEITATRGAVLYRGLLGWSALLPGTAGFVLSTNGAGADPTWVAPSGLTQPYGFAFGPKIPTASKIVGYFDSPVAWTLPAGLADCQGDITDSDTAVAGGPTAQTDFDIQSPVGTSIGTMRFAIGALTATFIKAAPSSLPLGQSAAIIAPAALNGITGAIAGTIKGTRP